MGDTNSEKIENLKKIFKILNIDISEISDLENIEINRDLLLTKNINIELNKLLDECKNFYKSSKLTCLHNNKEDKQKFPAVNLLRQILKCNNLKLTPNVISLGYSKISGKKLIQRNYIIKKIN